MDWGDGEDRADGENTILKSGNEEVNDAGERLALHELVGPRWREVPEPEQRDDEENGTPVDWNSRRFRCRHQVKDEG